MRLPHILVFAFDTERQAMQRKPETSQRKSPRQERSRATLDAIVTAAAQVLEASGYEGATTARVAELAGVSIGSLYQYFPNKEALISAVAEREVERRLVLLAEYLAEYIEAQGSGELATMVRGYIRALLKTYRELPKLYRILLEEVPKLHGLAHASEVDRRAVALLIAHLEAHRGDIVPEDLAVAAVVIVRAVRYNVLAWAVERPAGFGEETLAEELSQLVLKYLFSPPL
jgi:AcrR family transcriptional regulator